MPDIRSTRGCWTCRLRRKKCDETHPHCAVCTGLHIACDGYGTKPAYMEGDENAKQWLQHLKESIKQTGSRKRRGRPSVSNSVSLTGDVPKCIRNDIAPQPLGISLPSLQSRNNSLALPTGLGNKAISTELAFDSHISFSLSPSIFDQVPDTHDFYYPAEGIHMFDDFRSPLSADDFVGLDNYLFDAVDDSINASEGSRQHDLTDSEAPALSPLTPAVGGEEHGTVILMYYFDTAFHHVFPAYRHSIDTLGRGWLLVLANRSPAMYYAMLSIGAYHLSNPRRIDQSTTLQENNDPSWQKFYGLAIREFEVQTEILQVSDAMEKEEWFNLRLEMLGCVVHLISLQIMKGEFKNILTWLEKAVDILRQLRNLENQKPQTKPGTHELQFANNSHAHRSTSIDSILAEASNASLSFFTSAIVFIDTLLAASMRRLPLLHDQLEDLLQGEQIDTEGIFACQSGVLLTISKIISLDNWKRDAEKKRSLSVMELVTRATSIKTALTTGLNSSSLSGSASENHGINKSASLVTEVFARSALTLLHVVVSGPHPSLKEIQESVSATIQVFDSFPDPGLIRSAIWPFCISGCFAATEEQRYFFEELGRRADLQSDGHERYSKACEIMRTCWRLRDEGQDNVDWTMAMEVLGVALVLM